MQRKEVNGILVLIKIDPDDQKGQSAIDIYCYYMILHMIKWLYEY